MRRLGVTLLAVVVLIVGAGQASATCIVVPFDRLIESSQTIWWATVTASEPVLPPRRFGFGSWILTVHILRVLKGPGTEGATATVSVTSCVGPEPRSYIKKGASGYVGSTELFVRRGGGELVAVPLFAAPGVSSPEQQYRRALSDLKLAPLPMAHSNRVPIVVATSTAILLLAALLIVLRRRRLLRNLTDPDE